MRRRVSSGYLGFFILFLIINVAPRILRAFTQNSEGLAWVFPDIGNITNFLGRASIITVVLYFAWVLIGPNINAIDKHEEELRIPEIRDE